MSSDVLNFSSPAWQFAGSPAVPGARWVL